MATLMTLLRIIHIFSGALWVGGAFINVLFLQPTFQATAPESQRVIQHLNGRTRFLVTVYSVATLSVLSGLIMFAILSERPGYLGYELGLVCRAVRRLGAVFPGIMAAVSQAGHSCGRRAQLVAAVAAEKRCGWITRTG